MVLQSTLAVWELLGLATMVAQPITVVAGAAVGLAQSVGRRRQALVELVGLVLPTR
tara:strand:- start:283 stop:450 length:168 start_codon:yes stop_codon:yes gene_type:complete